jgi:AraC-like DNA-binding protein
METKGRIMKPKTVAKPLAVPAAAMNVLLDALEAIDGDVEGALRRAGLTIHERAVRQGRAALVPRAAFAQLTSECVLACHVESCRRNGLKPFPVRNHRILLLAMLNCASLRDALAVMVDFYEILGEDVPKWHVIPEGPLTRIVLEGRVRERRVTELLVTLYGLASYLRLMGWIVGQEIAPLDATFSYPDLPDHRMMAELLGLKASFARKQDSFAFESRFLDRPITRRAADIDELFALFPFDLLPPDYGDGRLTPRIVAAIRSALALGEEPAGLPMLAKTFGISESTFRRRLAAEGVSLTGIRVACRDQMARDLLGQTRLSVREIAGHLQYADAAAFRRAFRKWTGRTPQQWRTLQQ